MKSVLSARERESTFADILNEYYRLVQAAFQTTFSIALCFKEVHYSYIGYFMVAVEDC